MQGGAEADCHDDDDVDDVDLDSVDLDANDLGDDVMEDAAEAEGPQGNDAAGAAVDDDVIRVSCFPSCRLRLAFSTARGGSVS